MYIDIEHVTKEYLQNDSYFLALRNVSLQIAKGEFICLLGPSGCGKTTLLNAMAGFEPLTSGSISIDGRAVEQPSKKYLTIFQHYGLLPWRSVQKNVELGLEVMGMERRQRRTTAAKYVDLVGLGRFAGRLPCQLSGGMQQRVSIARALAVDPEILFMDEPFGALDAVTRFRMQDEIIDIWRSNRKTVIFVTHDIEEAVYLADRIVVMTPNPGKIKEILSVGLARPRRRTSPEFLELRSRVLEIFQAETPVPEEDEIDG